MAVTWKITKCVFDLEKDSKTNVITKVYYTVFDSTQTTEGKRGRIELDTSDLSSFIEYADLTESEVITFIKDAMGAEAVTAIEAKVEALVLEKTTGDGLPWV